MLLHCSEVVKLVNVPLISKFLITFYNISNLYEITQRFILVNDQISLQCQFCANNSKTYDIIKNTIRVCRKSLFKKIMGIHKFSNPTLQGQRELTLTSHGNRRSSTPRSPSRLILTSPIVRYLSLMLFIF